MTRLVFLLSPPPLLPWDGVLEHHRVTPWFKFVVLILYTWVKKGSLRVKYVAHENKYNIPGQGWNADHLI